MGARFRKRFLRAFREREIIFRSEGSIRYVRLGRVPQMTFAGALLCTTVWLAGANGLVWLQESRIEQKLAEIQEARVAYERLHGDMVSYQQRVALLAQEILSRSGADAPQGAVDLHELASVAGGIENAFDKINRDLNLTQADRERIIQSRDALHDQISMLESSLSFAQDQIAQLEGSVAERDKKLALERAEIMALSGSRDDWRLRAEELSQDLSTASRMIEELNARLDVTTTALSEERSRVEDLDDVRTRLARQVESLQSGLNAAQIRGERLTANVMQLTENLSTLETERIAMAGEREALSADLAVVEAELNLHQSATDKTRQRLETVVQKLTELTDASVLGVNGGDDVGALQALEMQIGDLMAELRSARNNAVDMEAAIGDVVVGLAMVAGDSPARLESINGTADKVSLTRELLDAVTSVQEGQHQLIAQLTQEAEDGISRNEGILKMAGLDVDKILRVAGFETGMGGPVDVASLDEGTALQTLMEPTLASELATNVEILQSRLMRMSALNDVMRCVPLLSPVDNFQMTSAFGKRKDPINGKTSFHGGIDIGGWSGIPVHVSAPGTVTFAGRNAGYGFMVEIDHGCGIKTIYAHLKKINVKKGEIVEHRKVIGSLGTTGRSTGPHVHYEVIVDGTKMDPEAFIEAGRHVHKI